VVLFLILANLSCVWAQAPLPVLRGILVTPDGRGRAFFEDPTTGALGAYAVGDVIDGNRIEQIREDAVILRRGDEVIRILMGSRSGPTIGKGQLWLDRLGIPPQALSTGDRGSAAARPGGGLRHPQGLGLGGGDS
jgi:hypothetical protein